MAFNLQIATTGVSSDGEQLLMQDITVYDGVDLRTNVALFIQSSVVVGGESIAVEPVSYDPETVTDWIIPTAQDGNYKVVLYAFYTKAGGPAAIAGDIRYDVTNNRLEVYSGSTWSSISPENAIGEEAAHSSDTYVPVLSKSYIYKNELNLEYIEESKKIIDNGINQNKLFFKRNTLDYFSALILGAEYNWALGAYTNVDSIINNLNAIMATDKLS